MRITLTPFGTSIRLQISDTPLLRIPLPETDPKILPFSCSPHRERETRKYIFQYVCSRIRISKYSHPFHVYVLSAHMYAILSHAGSPPLVTGIGTAVRDLYPHVCVMPYSAAQWQPIPAVRASSAPPRARGLSRVAVLQSASSLPLQLREEGACFEVRHPVRELFQCLTGELLLVVWFELE